MLPTILPENSHDRIGLHNELHARPAARIRMPALLICVMVDNAHVTLADEHKHLNALCDDTLAFDDIRNNFVNLKQHGYALRWEKHSEFSRYTLIQALDPAFDFQIGQAQLLETLSIDRAWLHNLPGKTLSALAIVMRSDCLDDANATVVKVKQWLGDDAAAAALIGTDQHSLLVTNYKIKPDGFMWSGVVTKTDSSQTRCGRIAQRFIDSEIYRILSLRGLPAAQELLPLLADTEQQLALFSRRMHDDKSSSDQELLNSLITQSSIIEHAIATHIYRFGATKSYEVIVQQRFQSLRECAILGTQTLSEFVLKRWLPAITTVKAVDRRLNALSERIARTSALLSTRVDIANQQNSQDLLVKLTKGQALQLRLQSMVESLSIAAISYYVVSLIAYGGKALKSVGWLPIDYNWLVGLSIVPVVSVVWWVTRRIHKKLHSA